MRGQRLELRFMGRTDNNNDNNGGGGDDDDSNLKNTYLGRPFCNTEGWELQMWFHIIYCPTSCNSICLTKYDLIRQ
jgi:hypothetical protein